MCLPTARPTGYATSTCGKPLPRWEFIVGKYCGLLLTLAVNIAAMTVALYVMLAWMNWTSPINIQRSWDTPAMDVRLLISVLLIFAEMALLTAVALFFSTFSSSALWSVVFTLGFFVAGLESEDLRNFGNIVDAPFMAHIVSAIGWVVPAFSAFDVKLQVVHGIRVPAGFVLQTLLYAAIYIGVALAAAVGLFSRREFK